MLEQSNKYNSTYSMPVFGMFIFVFNDTAV